MGSRCGWHGAGWHAGGWHAGGWHFDQENKTTYLEEPSQDQEENPQKAMQGWDSESSGLQAAGAVDYWGNSFCSSHHVGSWCSGFTQVRCCRASWGFVRCGSTVNSRRCGWHGAGWHAGGWRAGGWHFDQENKTTYLEEPSQDQEENPRVAMQGWDNESSSLQAAGAGWVIHAGWRQSSFCRAHHVGFFCSSHRKIQCCNDHGHYVECTTSVQRRYRC